MKSKRRRGASFFQIAISPEQAKKPVLTVHWVSEDTQNAKRPSLEGLFYGLESFKSICLDHFVDQGFLI